MKCIAIVMQKDIDSQIFWNYGDLNVSFNKEIISRNILVGAHKRDGHRGIDLYRMK